MDADGRQLQFGGKGAAVQRFDVDQLMDEAIRAGVDLVASQGIEHECIVGIGAMAHTDQLSVVSHRSILLGLFYASREKPEVAS